MDNETKLYINMLSGLVSYPMFSRILDKTNEIDSLGVLLEELDALLEKRDTHTALLLFQRLMGIAGMEIPPEILDLGKDDKTLFQFLCELSLDLDDYYEQECEELLDEVDFEDDGEYVMAEYDSGDEPPF